MTDLLKEAFHRAESLPECEQIALAGMILDELSSDERWRELFDSSEVQLSQMASEAVAEYRAGETEPRNHDSIYGRREL